MQIKRQRGMIRRAARGATHIFPLFPSFIKTRKNGPRGAELAIVRCELAVEACQVASLPCVTLSCRCCWCGCCRLVRNPVCGIHAEGSAGRQYSRNQGVRQVVRSQTAGGGQPLGPVVAALEPLDFSVLLWAPPKSSSRRLKSRDPVQSSLVQPAQFSPVQSSPSPFALSSLVRSRQNK